MRVDQTCMEKGPKIIYDYGKLIKKREALLIYRIEGNDLQKFRDGVFQPLLKSIAVIDYIRVDILKRQLSLNKCCKYSETGRQNLLTVNAN